MSLHSLKEILTSVSPKKSNQSETVPENTYGLVQIEETVNGSVSTKKFSLKKEPSILIRPNSEPSIITTLTMSDLPFLRGTYFSITTPAFYLTGMGSGISKGNVSMWSLLWILPLLLVAGVTFLVSLFLALMVEGTISFLKSIASKLKRSPTNSTTS